MKNRLRICPFVLMVLMTLTGCNSSMTEPAKETKTPPGTSVDAKIRRFAPTEITADISHLSEGDRKALTKIIDAAKLLDPLFLRQVWSGNEALQKKLAADTSPEGKAKLHYFRINVGPWSRLDNNEQFIDGDTKWDTVSVPREKPKNANYYPDDMTKEEFESWVKTLPEAQQRSATGFFSVIRRGADKKLKLVPYSEEYREFLEPAAKLLHEAADLTTNATLKNFITKRADALKSDDYYASDVAWMELDAPIDLTFGPYETYEDEMFGFKAGFEAYVTLRNEAESEKLKKFSGWLQELENNLPFDPKYRNPKLGALAPIRVVDLVFSAGDGNRGVQTAAFNLPNDERITAEKGAKRVMLKNTQDAKFAKVLVPISKIALAQKDHPNVDFDAFFTHILMHELMHGLGPHNITVGERPTTVRQELKEAYSTIEEAKADISGLFALQFLVDRGKLDKKFEQTMYMTYLASMFRSIRFGLNEAHGRGVAMQLNYFLDHGGGTVAPDGTFAVDTARIKQNVIDLTRDIMTMQ